MRRVACEVQSAKNEPTRSARQVPAGLPWNFSVYLGESHSGARAYTYLGQPEARMLDRSHGNLRKTNV